MDRIDLQLFVPRVEREALTATAGDGESSAVVAARVLQARRQQQARQGKANALLAPKQIDRYCPLTADARQLLDSALSRLSLSARAYHRVIRIARSIADLAGAETLDAVHVAEAVRYRALDRAP
jgi:magnesium chelatase family protein